MQLPVLIYTGRPTTTGGAEQQLLLLLSCLDMSRFRPIVATPGPGDLLDALPPGIARYRVVSDPRTQWLGSREARLRYYATLPEIVGQLQQIIDCERVALVQSINNHRIEAALAAAAAARPHVWAIHIPFSDFTTPRLPHLGFEPSSFASFVRALSDRIVCVSRGVAKTILDHEPHAPCHVINNGIDLARHDRAMRQRGSDIRSELQLPDNAPLVVLAGRVSYQKGFDVVPELARRIDQAVFVIAGALENEAYHQSILQAARTFRVERRIRFLGHRNDVPALLAQADAFLLPSRLEGHPLIVLQAMASRCPVVAANCPGIEETVSSSTGYTCDIDDIDSFARAIKSLLEDRTKAASMGVAGRERIERNFTAEHMTAKTECVWSEAVQEFRRNGPNRSALCNLFLRLYSQAGTDGLYFVSRGNTKRGSGILRAFRSWFRASGS